MLQEVYLDLGLASKSAWGVRTYVFDLWTLTNAHAQSLGSKFVSWRDEPKKNNGEFLCVS